jgi:hypothetical protein
VEAERSAGSAAFLETRQGVPGPGTIDDYARTTGVTLSAPIWSPYPLVTVSSVSILSFFFCVRVGVSWGLNSGPDNYFSDKAPPHPLQSASTCAPT